MLRLRVAELQTRLLHDQQTLDRVRRRLRLIETETTMTNVEVKSIAAQRVLCLRATVRRDDDKQHVEPLYERVIEYMDAAGADRASPISWREADGGVVHIHAGYLAPTGDVPGRDVVILPEVSVASVVRRGAVDSIGEASQALACWADAQGLAASVAAGRWRELYLETNDNDYSDRLVEVQLELAGRAATLLESRC
jgi:hypothetical protein